MSYQPGTVCSSTAGKHTVIRLPIIFGLFNGATSIHRPFQLYMRNTKSVEVGLCSTRRI